jgi:hypothetical protein
MPLPLVFGTPDTRKRAPNSAFALSEKKRPRISRLSNATPATRSKDTDSRHRHTKQVQVQFSLQNMAFWKLLASDFLLSTSFLGPKTDFFSIFFNHVFGRFSVRGVQKHDKKISTKNLTSPGTFLAPEEPTNHVKARHFFC